MIFWFIGAWFISVHLILTNATASSIFSYLFMILLQNRKGGTGCTAHIKVSGAGGVLSVVDWNMDHNHTVQALNMKPCTIEAGQDLKTDETELATPELPSVDDPNDQTGAFMNAFPQMWFSTFAEFEERLREFERITGAQYTKWKGDKFRDNRPERGTLVYRRLTYACYHFGESRQNEHSRNR